MRATESARSENARNLSRFFNESGYIQKGIVNGELGFRWKSSRLGLLRGVRSLIWSLALLAGAAITPLLSRRAKNSKFAPRFGPERVISISARAIVFCC